MICLPLSIHEDSISIKKEARKSNASEVEKKKYLNAMLPCPLCAVRHGPSLMHKGRDNEEF